MLGGHVVKEDHLLTLVGVQTHVATMEISVKVLQKARNRSTYDPALSHLSIEAKEISAHQCLLPLSSQ